MLDRFLKSTTIIPLFILPLLFIAVKVIASLLGSNSDSYDLIFISLVLGIPYLIYFSNEIFRLQKQITTLPSLIYGLLCLGVTTNTTHNYILISTLLIVIAFLRMYLAFERINHNSMLFDFALLVSLAIMITPQLFILYLWVLISYILLGRRTTLRDTFALIVGLLTPIFFYAVYLFMTDNLHLLQEIYDLEKTFNFKLNTYPTNELVIISSLLILSLTSLLKFLFLYNSLTLFVRRSLTIHFILITFVLTIYLTTPTQLFDIIYLLAFPLSIIISFLFLNINNKYINGVVFALLLTLCTYLLLI